MYEKFTLWVSIAVWDGQLEVDRPFLDQPSRHQIISDVRFLMIK